jgi:hypothetical protein
LEAEKLIRAVLNKVSEGNIDPMFQELSKVLKKGFNKKTRVHYCNAYATIFLSLVASQQQ